jgi:hypothetical protein
VNGATAEPDDTTRNAPVALLELPASLSSDAEATTNHPTIPRNASVKPTPAHAQAVRFLGPASCSGVDRRDLAA